MSLACLVRASALCLLLGITAVVAPGEEPERKPGS